MSRKMLNKLCHAMNGNISLQFHNAGSIMSHFSSLIKLADINVFVETRLTEQQMKDISRFNNRTHSMAFSYPARLLANGIPDFCGIAIAAKKPIFARNEVENFTQGKSKGRLLSTIIFDGNVHFRIISVYGFNEELGMTKRNMSSIACYSKNFSPSFVLPAHSLLLLWGISTATLILQNR